MNRLFVQSRSFLTSSILFSLLISILATAPAEALDIRTIDVVTVTWAGAKTLPGSAGDVRSAIETDVKIRWRNLTTIYGDTEDRRIEFNFGVALSEPLTLRESLPCERLVTAWSDTVREETYRRLGIANNESRYLVIVAPNNGCIWSGLANIGDPQKVGGTLVLHDSVKGFVIAHELGHLLGLGHSNLMRCNGDAKDGPWSMCRAVEYGGSIDLMSNVDVTTPLSTYNQWRMGLLAKSDIVQSWKSESIEINAVDVFGKPRAIFLRDGNSTYWLEFRSASSRYKGGLVIYRTDPPPGSSVVSPNPSDALQIASSSVGTDTWMLNLDSFTYSSSSSSSTGSMTLPQGEAVILHSGNISIQATPSGTSSAVVSITRNMKPSVAIPVLTPSSTWVSPNSPLLDRNYISNLNAIEQVEINVNGAVKSWTPQTQKDWKPTYLDPLTAPRIPVIQDLPEGQYEFTLRLKDMSGVWTSWSAPARANIDRGYPLTGKTIAFKELSGEFVSVSLTDFKDEGSGLCLTQLINPDGWVTNRSVERINPSVNLRSNSVMQTEFQTYDCLGNGKRGLLKSSMKYFAAEKLTRRGSWKTASKPLPTGSLQCVRSCQVSLVTSGPTGIVVGSGSFEYEFVGEKKFTYKASQKPDKYSILSINSSQRKTLRITGKDFTLIGLIRGSISIDKVEMDQRVPNAIDTSLDSAAQRALSRFGFTSEDFSNGWSVLPMSRGTTLEDPSLDLCASDYLSESDRIERRQVVATKENSPYTFLSSEVVRYSSEFAAQKAIEELKQKYVACVTNVGGKEKNGSFVKYSFLPIPGNVIDLVEENNRLIVHAKIGEGNSTRYLFAVYQFSGDIFSGLYVVRPEASPFSNEEITRWLYAGSVIAKRIENSKRY